MRKYISTRVKKAWASLALLSAELVLVLVLFVLSLFVFAFLVFRVIRLREEKFDLIVFRSLEPFVTDTNTSLMKFITFFGTHTFLIPANLLVIAYFLFIKKHRWYSIKVPVVAIGSVTAMMVLKLFFSRVRPDTPLLEEVKGFSFPSGHAMSAMTFYGLLIYLAYKYIPNPTLKALVIAFLSMFILAIGFSRIYLRVHYASDVIAGFSIGTIWLVLALWVTRKIEKSVARKKELRMKVEQPG